MAPPERQTKSAAWALITRRHGMDRLSLRGQDFFGRQARPRHPSAGCSGSAVLNCRRESSGRSAVQEPGARYASVSGAPRFSGRILQRVSINPSDPASDALNCKFICNLAIRFSMVSEKIQLKIEIYDRGPCLLRRGSFVPLRRITDRWKF